MSKLFQGKLRLAFGLMSLLMNIGSWIVVYDLSFQTLYKSFQ